MLTLLILLLPVAVLADNHIARIWNAKVLMGSKITLYCNDTVDTIQQGEVGEWKVPSGEILPNDHNSTHFMVETYNGIMGHTLHVKTVTESTQGVYVCSIKDNNSTTRVSILRLVNYDGPEYESRLKEYETHIIIAVVATAVFIGLFGTVCLVYRFRYREPESHRLREVRNGPPSTTDIERKAYDNQAFQERGIRL